MPGPYLTAGRTIMTLANLFYTLGAFAADWNETHIYNPRWPPHARFHNGQTMSLGVLLAAFSLTYVWRPAFTKLSAREVKESVWVSAMVGSFYCAAGCTAILYPGANWFDPEHSREGIVQGPVFAGVVVLMWVGYWLEGRRMDGAKGKVS
nr:hypothetical protein B0A51_13274 [Rachicladosporium sp. CCFEE 5018]